MPRNGMPEAGKDDLLLGEKKEFNLARKGKKRLGRIIRLEDTGK